MCSPVPIVRRLGAIGTSCSPADKGTPVVRPVRKAETQAYCLSVRSPNHSKTEKRELLTRRGSNMRRTRTNSNTSGWRNWFSTARNCAGYRRSRGLRPDGFACSDQTTSAPGGTTNPSDPASRSSTPRPRTHRTRRALTTSSTCSAPTGSPGWDPRSAPASSIRSSTSRQP